MPMPSEPATHHSTSIVSDGAPVDEEQGRDRRGCGTQTMAMAVIQLISPLEALRP